MHPAYKLVCLPVYADSDCHGGSGKGPAFVQGPLSYEGTDVFALDRDGNGNACERLDLKAAGKSQGGVHAITLPAKPVG